MTRLKVADIGSGPVSKLELDIKGPVTLQVSPSDSKHGVYEDMEKLSYADGSFDIVHCRNALDHTKDALAAVKEMIRICAPGGRVYIKCWLDQKNTGYKHYWNAKEDGTFTNGQDSFDLRELGFDIKYTNHGGERRYNYIEATLEKKWSR